MMGEIDMVTIIDGQGGGIGRALIEGLRKKAPELEIVAVGTNALATSAMLRAGASHAATGENAVIHCCGKATVIAGPIGIVLADALFGEMSAAMAAAVARSSATRVLVPVNKCGTVIAGVPEQPIAAYVADAVERVLRLVGEESACGGPDTAGKGQRSVPMS